MQKMRFAEACQAVLDLCRPWRGVRFSCVSLCGSVSGGDGFTRGGMWFGLSPRPLNSQRCDQPASESLVVQAYFHVQVLPAPFSRLAVREKEHVKSLSADTEASVQHGNRLGAAVARNRYHCPEFQQVGVGGDKHRAVRVDAFSACRHVVAEPPAAFFARAVGSHEHPDGSRRRAGGLTGDLDNGRYTGRGRGRRRRGHFGLSNRGWPRCDQCRQGLVFRFRQQLGDVAKFRRFSRAQDQGRRTSQKQ